MENPKDQLHASNPGGELEMAKLGGGGTGVPYYAMLDAEGNWITDSKMPAGDEPPENLGYPSGGSAKIGWFMHGGEEGGARDGCGGREDAPGLSGETRIVIGRGLRLVGEDGFSAGRGEDVHGAEAGEVRGADVGVIREQEEAARAGP